MFRAIVKGKLETAVTAETQVFWQESCGQAMQISLCGDAGPNKGTVRHCCKKAEVLVLVKEALVSRAGNWREIRLDMVEPEMALDALLAEPAL